MSNPFPEASAFPKPTSPGQVPGHKSTILHAHGKNHAWTGHGPLSIKSFARGQAFYRVDGGQFLVDESGYLLLNRGQEYTVFIESDRPVESFCIFFAEGLAEEVFASATAHPAILLDNPEAGLSQPLHFYDRFYAHDMQLSPVLSHLRTHYSLYGGESGWLDESLRHLMQKLLHVHHRVIGEVATLPAMRAATREELYRRLHRVRDYMAANYDQSLTLAEMAQVACLSPNHLLRVFKQLFHQSPHQYLRGLRLERARKLLLNSEATVTEICHIVGFESLGSFSWRFRRQFGMSPEQFRAANR